MTLDADSDSPDRSIRKAPDVFLGFDPLPDHLRHLLDTSHQIDDIGGSARNVLQVNPRRFEDRSKRGLAGGFELTEDGRYALRDDPAVSRQGCHLMHVSTLTW